jgi:hypothetical protein
MALLRHLAIRYRNPGVIQRTIETCDPTPYTMRQWVAANQQDPPSHHTNIKWTNHPTLDKDLLDLSPIDHLNCRVTVIVISDASLTSSTMKMINAWLESHQATNMIDPPSDHLNCILPELVNNGSPITITMYVSWMMHCWQAAPFGILVDGAIAYSSLLH